MHISCICCSYLSRQDLVSWKIALDRRELPGSICSLQYFLQSKVLSRRTLRKDVNLHHIVNSIILWVMLKSYFSSFHHIGLMMTLKVLPMLIFPFTSYVWPTPSIAWSSQSVPIPHSIYINWCMELVCRPFKKFQDLLMQTEYTRMPVQHSWQI